MTAADAPAHDSHLGPRVVRFADKGVPRISLEQKRKKATVGTEERADCIARCWKTFSGTQSLSMTSFF